MATEPKITTTAASLAANAVLNTLSSGSIGIFSGAVPVDAASSGGTLLALLLLASTASSTAASGVGTFNTIPASTVYTAGTAAFFRIYANGATSSGSSGGTAQGLVAASGADLNFNSVAFSAGASVSISSFTFTQKTS